MFFLYLVRPIFSLPIFVLPIIALPISGTSYICSSCIWSVLKWDPKMGSYKWFPMEWGGSRKPSFRRSPAPWDRVWTFTFNIQQRSNINSNMFSVEWNHFEKKHGNITTSRWQNFEKKLRLFFLVWEREARHLLGEDFCFDDNQTCGEAFDRCSPLIVWFWSMLGKPTPTRKDDFFWRKIQIWK